jgi:hypothetical protein
MDFPLLTSFRRQGLAIAVPSIALSLNSLISNDLQRKQHPTNLKRNGQRLPGQEFFALSSIFPDVFVGSEFSDP